MSSSESACSGDTPGLTVVGTVAFAVAIALGTLYFEALNKWQNRRLPVRDPHRMISVRGWGENEFHPENRTLYDYAIWREQVKTMETTGVAIQFVRNLAAADECIVVATACVSTHRP